MEQESTKSVGVSALRAIGLSPDGKEVTISLRMRYSTSERTYSVPIECFYDLIVDLRRLNASAGSEMPEAPETEAHDEEPVE